MEKKGRKWLYAVIVIVIILVGEMAVRLVIANAYKMQQNIFFTEYDMDETAVLKYDPLRGEVSEVGRVKGKFCKCVIDGDEAYITGVVYDGDKQGTQLVQYELATGMIGYRDLEGIVEDATGTNTGKKLLIYAGGNKLLVSYFDANQDEMCLFCDLATGQNEIIKGDECQVAQFLGVYDDTLWYKTYVGGTLYQYDLKTQEKTKVLDFVHDAVVNSDAGIIAYTKKNNSQMLYLYNMNDRKTKYLPLMRWNTYYSDMYETS